MRTVRRYLTPETTSIKWTGNSVNLSSGVADFTVLAGFDFTEDTINLGDEINVTRNETEVTGTLVAVANISDGGTMIFVKFGASELNQLGQGTYNVSSGNKDLGTITYDGSFGELTVSQPTYELWYTSDQGSVLWPGHYVDDNYVYFGVGEGEDDFGANIISNTYSGNKGIIKFDGPITSICDYAFGDTDKLRSIWIPDSVETVGSFLPYCTTDVYLSRLYTSPIFIRGANANIYIDVDSVDPDYDLTDMLHTGGPKSGVTYRIFTDSEMLKEQALAMNGDYSTVTVKHYNGTDWE